MNPIISWNNDSAVDQAKALLNDGGVLLSSTDTILGLSAKVNDGGVAALDAIKKRNHTEKPYLILVGSSNDALELLEVNTCRLARILMEQCWPGPLTIIAVASHYVPHYAVSEQGTIALRLPAHAGLQRLLAETGPLFSTSANISGQPVPKTLDTVSSDILNRVGLILLDQERTHEIHSHSSTIIDCSGKHAVLIRAGAYPLIEIQEALGDERLLLER